ncbi:MAG TPA: hypothetical protein VIC04_07700 [Terriglobia bacterium]|jgi:hypothetical protein
MYALDTTALLILAAAIAGLATLGTILWRRHHRKSPAERERVRRLAVNRMGRLTDAALIEVPLEENPVQSSDLIFYRYRVGGLEFTAAQDVSSLRHLIEPQTRRPGAVAAIKYDPRRPSNSILVCEEWNGLRERQKEEVPQRSSLARQR